MQKKITKKINLLPQDTSAVGALTEHAGLLIAKNLQQNAGFFKASKIKIHASVICLFMGGF